MPSHADNQHDLATPPEATTPWRRRARRLAAHALHPVVQVAALVSLHSAALLVVEKTPLLALLSLH
ncbi:hypothetical protein J2S43_001096 [Catenuloplanes nepalensis]|uniref:Uncharacterized protein n=1 Tax=Catenuloplanes nepalensis TaxID=587533 RepID=A0ABT9MMD1_9ACTN|nr:hypothetical protein [Catenuloplanes nepalensis]MDP9792584.1 hypothetical protein [Catenuloplanes nepalensis]